MRPFTQDMYASFVIVVVVVVVVVFNNKYLFESFNLRC